MDLPTRKVQELARKGLTNEEITRSLEGQGFNLDEIATALNQAKLMEGAEMPNFDQDIPIPEQQEQYPGYQGGQYSDGQYPQQQEISSYSLPQAQNSYEDVQAIVEEVLEEKWKEFMKDVGDIIVWKARVSDDLEATKQEIVRTQKRMEDLQVAVLGKVNDYHKTMNNIGSDMKALESVFGKILEPLTSNIKELNKVTEELRSKTAHHTETAHHHSKK